MIRSARVLFVDHYGVEGMTRAARIAREAGLAVVADLERDEQPGFETLLELVDHLIVSRAFAARRTGTDDPTAAARHSLGGGPQRRCRHLRRGRMLASGADGTSPVHQPAFRVPVVDTTGCGDVFHGAYAAALARGLDLADRVRFASAAAALKAMHAGAQAGIPTRAEVEAFADLFHPLPSEGAPRKQGVL